MNMPVRSFRLSCVGIFACVLVTGCLSVLYAQTAWEKTAPLVGQRIVSILVNNDDVIFAGTARGMYHSKDHGETWPIFTTDFIDFLIRSPYGNLYLSSRGGIYQSTNEGYAWTGTSFPGSVQCMTWKSVAEFFIGTPNAGVYRTMDSGRTWLQIGLEAYIFSLAVGENGEIHAGTNRGIYRSTDDGLVWKRTFTDTVNVTRLLAVPGGRLFAATPRGLLSSIGEGSTWTWSGFRDTVVMSLDSIGNNGLIVGTDHDGVFQSTDAGQSWHRLTSSSFQAGANAIVHDKRGDLFVGTDFGIYHIVPTESVGVLEEQWLYPHKDTLSSSAISLTRDGTLIAQTENYYPGSVRYYSTDRGHTWTPIGNTFSGMMPSCTDSARITYAAAVSSLFRSTDGGIHWIPVGPLPTDFQAIARGPGNSLLGVTLKKLLISSDQGKNWASYGNAPDSTLRTVFMDSRENIFISRWDWANERLWRSTDHGQTWTKADSVSQLVLSYHETPGGILFAYCPWYRLARSTNHGDTWELLGDIRSRGALSMVSDDEGIIYKGSDDGISYSRDSGTTWKTNNSGIRSVYATSLQRAADGTLFACAGGQIYRSTVNIAGVERFQGAVPVTPQLLQNYPNPFNPTTRIEYLVPAKGHTELRIYDLQGKTVASLVDEEKTAGRYTVEWNASAVASGVYYYRLSTGGLTTVRKLVVVR